jgi:hypothetical protein
MQQKYGNKLTNIEKQIKIKAMECKTRHSLI